MSEHHHSGTYFVLVAPGTETLACADFFRNQQLAEESIEFLELTGKAEVRKIYAFWEFES